MTPRKNPPLRYRHPPEVIKSIVILKDPVVIGRCEGCFGNVTSWNSGKYLQAVYHPESDILLHGATLFGSPQPERNCSHVYSSDNELRALANTLDIEKIIPPCRPLPTKGWVSLDSFGEYALSPEDRESILQRIINGRAKDPDNPDMARLARVIKKRYTLVRTLFDTLADSVEAHSRFYPQDLFSEEHL